MKAENDLDFLCEGDPTALNTDVYHPSVFFVMKAESEVSHDFG